MVKKQLFLFFLSLSFIGVVTAQEYPTDSWRDLADTTWYQQDQDEFDLSSAEALAGLSQLVEEGHNFEGKTLNITADINLDGHLWDPIGYDNDAAFSGTVQGHDHTISNLWITGLNRDFIGLFGQTIGASFYDLNLDTAHIDDSGDDSGALVANIFTNGTMKNCHAYNIDMTVTGVNIGGLNGGVLTDSKIINCSFEGSVTGTNQIGGITGSNWDHSVVKKCYVNGSVTGEYIVGGIVGFMTIAMGPNRDSKVIDCYSRASVTATDPLGMAGGAIGMAQGATVIKNVYSTGSVAADDGLGGFIGIAGSIDIENAFFDTETSGQDNGVGDTQGPPMDYGITGKTTAEMTVSAFADSLNNGRDDGPWLFDAARNDGYPILESQLGVPNFSKANNPILIYPTLTQGKLTIVTNASSGKFAIFSTNGRFIRKGDLTDPTSTLQVNELEPGVYFLRIQTHRGVSTQRFIRK